MSHPRDRFITVYGRKPVLEALADRRLAVEKVLVADNAACDCKPAAVCDLGNPNECCTAGSGPGCSNPACCEAICAIDPFCCDVEWDSICAGEACALENT